MNPAVNFVIYVLPNFPKLDKPKTKGADYCVHKARIFIHSCFLKQFYGDKEWLINQHWHMLYDQFEKKNIPVTHYREYEHDGGALVLELINKEKVK